MTDPFTEAAADWLADEIATDAIFEGSGDPVQCRADRRYNLEISDTYGTVIEVAVAITLERAAVGLPRRGAIVTIDGREHRVERIVTHDDDLVTVSCTNG